MRLYEQIREHGLQILVLLKLNIFNSYATVNYYLWNRWSYCIWPWISFPSEFLSHLFKIHWRYWDDPITLSQSIFGEQVSISSALVTTPYTVMGTAILLDFYMNKSSLHWSYSMRLQARVPDFFCGSRSGINIRKVVPEYVEIYYFNWGLGYLYTE